MSMLIQISAGGADIGVKASGHFSADVMDDLVSWAKEAFTHATTEPGEQENVVRSNHGGDFQMGFLRNIGTAPDLPEMP